MTDVQALTIAAAAFVMSFSGATLGDIVTARASAAESIVALAQASTAPMAEAAPAAPRGQRYGIALSPPQGGEQSLPILGVSEVAEAAGVREGDRIISINGTAVSQIAPADFGAYMRTSPLTLVVERGDETLTFEMSLG